MWANNSYSYKTNILPININQLIKRIRKFWLPWILDYFVFSEKVIVFPLMKTLSIMWANNSYYIWTNSLPRKIIQMSKKNQESFDYFEYLIIVCSVDWESFNYVIMNTSSIMWANNSHSNKTNPFPTKINQLIKKNQGILLILIIWFFLYSVKK